MGQQERRNCWNHTQPEVAGQRLASFRREVDELLHIAQHEASLRRNLLSLGRDRDTSLGTVDQLRIEGGLEFLDGIAECRLRYE